VNIVILAAGPGKRMHSHTPKVLHRLAGRALLCTCLMRRRARARVICVVYGPAAKRAGSLGGERAVWSSRKPQLGTGHAVMQARRTWTIAADSGPVRRRAADSLCDASKRLIDAAGKGLIAHRDARQSRRIRTCLRREKSVGHRGPGRQRKQRALREITPASSRRQPKKLQSWLTRLQNNNAQEEYYLTDIVGLATGERVPVTRSRRTRHGSARRDSKLSSPSSSASTSAPFA